VQNVATNEYGSGFCTKQAVGYWLILTQAEREILIHEAKAAKRSMSAMLRMMIHFWDDEHNHRPASPDPHRKAGKFFPDDEGHE